MAPVSFATKVLRLSLAAMLIIVCLSATSFAQFCEVVVTVGDTTAFPNTTSTVISVFADNLPAAGWVILRRMRPRSWETRTSSRRFLVRPEAVKKRRPC